MGNDAGQPPMIHRAMVKAMRLAKAVGKDGFNEQQRYPFRGIDGTVNVLGPALRDAGVFVTPEVLDSVTRDVLTTQDKKTRETTVRVRFTFWAEDGSNVSAVVPGESLDTSDKGTAKAMSVAFRIALLQVFALPTQEPSTDDNGHYHTRGGTPTLSGWTASYGRAMIDHGDMDEVIDFWTAIVESGSIEAPNGHANDETWGEGIATRITEFVSEENSPEVLRELYGKLKTADMLGLFHADESGRYTLGDLIVDKGKQAKLNRDKTFDHCMQLVVAAADTDALDAAMLHVRADTEPNGLLTAEQHSQILAVAEERYAKMVVENNVPAPPAEEPREFLPPVGESWDAFVAACGTPNMDADQIDALLTGEGDTTPACEFGAEGVQYFIDAVRRTHRLSRTITDEDRSDLLRRLAEHMELNGITWHEEIK